MLSIKDITTVSILSVILVIQEELLNFLPNISLTVFLIVLYSKKLGTVRTCFIVGIYCLLDNLIMSSFNIIYTPFMLIGWLVIPFSLKTIFRKINNVFALSILGILFSFVYCWIYIIPNVLILNIDLCSYLVSDVLFEVLLAASSFITILWLYEPSSKAMDKLIGNSK